MEMISKKFYLSTYIGCIVLATVLIIGGQFLYIQDILPYGFEWVGLAFVWGALIPLVIEIFIVCKLFSKGWSLIKDEQVSMTAGKVWFMFIPLFNLYWIFPIIWGFAKAYNSYLGRYKISIPELPERIFLISCVLFVADIILRRIPVVGIVFTVVTIVVFLLVLNKTCNALNSLIIKQTE